MNTYCMNTYSYNTDAVKTLRNISYAAFYEA